MTRRTAAVALAPLFALMAAACGGGSSTPTTAPEGVDVEVFAVDGIAWNTTTYRATAEDGEVTIFGSNNSGLQHNLHIQDGDGAAVTADFIDLPSRGSSGSLTVALEPGEYRIVCLVPGHQKMNSLLVVS